MLKNSFVLVSGCSSLNKEQKITTKPAVSDWIIHSSIYFIIWSDLPKSTTLSLSPSLPLSLSLIYIYIYINDEEVGITHRSTSRGSDL